MKRHTEKQKLSCPYCDGKQEHQAKDYVSDNIGAGGLAERCICCDQEFTVRYVKPGLIITYSNLLDLDDYAEISICKVELDMGEDSPAAKVSEFEAIQQKRTFSIPSTSEVVLRVNMGTPMQEGNKHVVWTLPEFKDKYISAFNQFATSKGQ